MEPLLPVRGSLVSECVRVIRARVAAGEWAGHLPGERRLAQVLQVGRDTVRLALRQLELERVIDSAAAGSRRKVLAGRSETGESERMPAEMPMRVGMLSVRKLEHLPQPVLLEVDHLRGSLASRGGSLELFAPPWYESANPGKRLEELLAAEHSTVWLLHRSSAAVQGWFAEHAVPCLIRGYPHPGIALPHLDVDWKATARHAASLLWRLGHRRVAVLVPPDYLRGVQAAVEGAVSLGEPDFEAIPMAEDGSAAGLTKVLARALQGSRPPTAVITTRPRQAATALTWLTGNGLRVPGDISLVSLAHEPFLDHLVPEVTCYRADPEKVARLVVRRLERIVAGQTHPGGSPWISPDLVTGASTSRPGSARN